MLRAALLLAALGSASLNSAHATRIDAARAADASKAYIQALSVMYTVLSGRSAAPLTAEQLTRAIKPGVQLDKNQYVLANALLTVRVKGSGRNSIIETVCRATGVTTARAHRFNIHVLARCNELPTAQSRTP